MKLVKIAEGSIGLLLIASAAAGDVAGPAVGAALLAHAFGVKL